MAKFETHLQSIITHTQQRVHPRSFVMYQPPHLTLAYFSESGEFNVIADTVIDPDYTKTFTQLYSQLNAYISNMRGVAPT